MMNGGDILTLQRVLGQKYAHFSPGHMAEVILLNPLARICEKKKVRNSRPKMKLDEFWTEARF